MNTSTQLPLIRVNFKYQMKEQDASALKVHASASKIHNTEKP